MFTGVNLLGKDFVILNFDVTCQVQLLAWLLIAATYVISES